MGKPADLGSGTLDLLILGTLEPGPLHDVGIAQHIEDLTSGRGMFLIGLHGERLTISLGNIYPAIGRVAKNGWIESEWKEPEGKRRVRVNTLTASGHAQLAERKAELETFMNHLPTRFTGTHFRARNSL